MMDKLHFSVYGKDSDFVVKLINDIMECSDDRRFAVDNESGCIAVFLPDFCDFGSIDCDTVSKAVCHYNAKNAILKSMSRRDIPVLAYAIETNEADITAKNVTCAECFSFFELLHDNEIGRVYYSSNASDLSVLAVVSAATAAGIKLSDIKKYFSKDRILLTEEV